MLLYQAIMGISFVAHYQNIITCLYTYCLCNLEGVVAEWCNPLTLQPEQSGGQSSIPGRPSPLERHDNGSRFLLGLLYFHDPSTWR